MSQGAGEGHHRVEGVEDRGEQQPEPGDPHDREEGGEGGSESGTTMTPGGAMPSGGNMDNWATAMPNADATQPETLPDTKSESLPGESESRDPV